VIIIKEFYTRKIKYHLGRTRTLGFQENKKDFSKGYLSGLNYRYERDPNLASSVTEINKRIKLKQEQRKIYPKGSSEDVYCKGYISSMYDQKKELTKKAKK